MASSPSTIARISAVQAHNTQVRAAHQLAHLRDCEACLRPSVPTRYETIVGGFVCEDGCTEG